MAPRGNWKGFLRLSLVTCPVALYPATSDSEKISFSQINKKTGHRIKYVKVDADTGEEVSSDEITKGYKVDTDTYIDPRTSWKTLRSNPPARSTSTVCAEGGHRPAIPDPPNQGEFRKKTGSRETKTSKTPAARAFLQQ